MATIPQQNKKTSLDIEIKAVDMQDIDIVSTPPVPETHSLTPPRINSRVMSPTSSPTTTQRSTSLRCSNRNSTRTRLSDGM